MDTFLVLYAWVAAIVFVFQVLLNLGSFREEYYFYVHHVQGYIPEDWQDRVVAIASYLGFIAGSLVIFLIIAFFWWYFLGLVFVSFLNDVIKESNNA